MNILNLKCNSNNRLQRPVTTLFMLMSVDGKISTGATDELDVDIDFPKINGVKEGLHMVYAISVHYHSNLLSSQQILNILHLMW